MGEEDVAAEEDVGRARGEAADAVDERWIDSLAAELVDELVVVDFAAFLGLDLPWIHNLLLFFFFVFFVLLLLQPKSAHNLISGFLIQKLKKYLPNSTLAIVEYKGGGGDGRREREGERQGGRLLTSCDETS